MDTSRVLIGIVARLITWAGAGLIVGDAVVNLWQDDRIPLAIAAAVAFPLTFFVWPWTHDLFGVSLIILFVATMIAYPISTFIGGLDTV